jgi:hypothetical protein
MKTIIYLSALCLLATSCTKVIELDLKDAESKITIDGVINNMPGPYTVKVNKSVPFGESSIYPEVADALVVISDDAGTVDTLTYKGNGAYQTSKINGVAGRTYNLNVKANGVEYKATSTMPIGVDLDTLLQQTIQAGPQTRKVIFPSYVDAPTLGNNYHFLLKVNGKLDPAYVLWNDNATNGQVSKRPIRTNFEINSGDTVEVEMRSYNLASYNYFYTLSLMQSNGPGGGTTPTNPGSNISNNALGIFSAHYSSIKTKIID